MRQVQTTTVTAQVMMRKSPPALRRTSAIPPDLPAIVNHLSFARTRSLSNRLTSSGAPESLIRTGGVS